MKFTDLDLSPEILAGLKDMKYVDLTPVQEITFPDVLAGKDLLARAETGSGKTGACAIPMIQNVDAAVNAVQGLILVPTRELALQYVQEIADIARHTDVQPFAVYGGFSMQIQNSKLAHGVHILVATPGRLIDLIYNSPLSLSQVRTFVLDEADEMLNMGFIDDVEFVISCLVHEHQTLLFSATMPQQIKQLSQKHLRDPVMVELNTDQVTPQNLRHHFELVHHSKRLEVLTDYIKTEQVTQAIIFCNSRHGGEKLYHQLAARFKSIDFIHGGLEQAKRTSMFNRFRRKEIKLMVATDVASRGLDFSHVSHVINYDFPFNREGYTHRTGRTARMGREGVAMTLFGPHDLRALQMVIKDNNIEPIWHGSEPDFKNASRHGSHGRRGGRPRGRRPRKRTPSTK